MLGRYAADPGRWREVLLLYCGLCTQPDAVSRILESLLGRDEFAIALTALTEARVVDPIVAGRVLEAAAGELTRHSEPNAAIIAGLGYVAANPRSTFGLRAADLLHRLLRYRGDRLPNALLQELLLAALRRPTPELTTHLIDNLERLDLGRILPAMADDALLVSASVLRQRGVSLAKKREWIDGLRRAQALPILIDLDAQTWLGPELKHSVSVALAQCSDSYDFWTLVDKHRDAREVLPGDTEQEAGIVRRWGWPYQPPVTTRGRNLCCRLALHLSQEVSREAMDGVHLRLQYLAYALAREQRQVLRRDRELARTIAAGRPRALRAIWRLAGKDRWARWVERSEVFPALNVGTAFVATNVMLTLQLLASVMGQLAGWGDLGIPWAPKSIGLFLGGGAVTLVALERTQGNWTHAIWGAIIPLMPYAALVGSIISYVIGDNWVTRTRRSAYIMAIVGAVLPTVALVTTSTGMGIRSLLFALAVVNPIFLMAYSNQPTHPLSPSFGTVELLRLLRKAPTNTAKRANDQKIDRC